MAEIKTRDMGFASYLLMLKSRFLRVEAGRGTVRYWIFETEESDAELMTDWLNSESMNFYQAFRELKNTLMSEGGRFG